MIKEAKYYKQLDNNNVKCVLCPHECIISPESRGKCKVRKNIEGKLYSENFSIVSAIHNDPIEKKPLYHFYPGKNILSIGSIGCNLKCKFCQNHNISQTTVDKFSHAKIIIPDVVINEAKRTRNNIGIAYTYNEPTVWYEFMLETAEKARAHKMKNIVVTNGYIKKEPLEELINYTDAFNIDLKAYTEKFYKKQTKATLKPVLKTIERISTSKTHYEITNLIIPGLNDKKKIFKEMVKILADINKDTVLHLSRYFPSYKTTIEPTNKTKMLKLFEIAKKYLDFVYLGNMITDRGQNTYCPKCNTKLISRSKYFTQINGLSENTCINCRKVIPVIY